MSMRIDDCPILYAGSVKKVRRYSSSAETAVCSSSMKSALADLIFEFTDQVSVFDWGALPDPIPGKGKSLVKMGALFFEALSDPLRWKEFSELHGSLAWVHEDGHLASELERLTHHGLKTHYRGVISESGTFSNKWEHLKDAAGIVVEQVRVVRPRWIPIGSDQVPFYGSIREKGELIPLEVVFRFKLVGGSSILSRRSDLKVGDQFQKPLIEFFSKLEPQDRFLNYSEAITVSGLSPEKWAELYSKTQLVSSFLQFIFSRMSAEQGGIDLIDGKFEWALSSDGELMLVDSIGPDELRLIKEGRDLSKETLREFYRKTEWYKEVQAVKQVAMAQGDAEWKKKVKVQPVGIPEAIQKSVASAYAELAEELENLVSENARANSEKVILVGSGGREHALAHHLLLSPQVKTLVWPTQNEAVLQSLRNVFRHKKIEVWSEVPATGDLPSLVTRAKNEGVTFAIIGPDAYLEAGMTDLFSKSGIPCFGPTRAGAELEWSKSFGKEVMKAAAVPTAKSWSFSSRDEVKKLLGGLSWSHRWVIKADTLAAGKGVEICSTLKEAEQAFERLATLSEKWVIEEFLEGREVSLFAFCDGETASVFEAARDFKTLNDDQTGPNTGGMGAISPVTDLDPTVVATARDRVFLPVLKEMKKRGKPYVGLLYAGLMVSGKDYWVLEFNARFGDPETQALLPRLQGDFFSWLKASTSGKLNLYPAHVPFLKETSVFVVAAAEGYPESPKKGDAILGLETWVASSETRPHGFFAGVKKDRDQYFTHGGRVLGALGMGPDASEATKRAYQELDQVQFKGKHYRSDVGPLRSKLVVLASGRGSNFGAIARAIREKQLCAKITLLICNRKDALVFDQAKNFGVDAIGLSSESAVIEKIKEQNPDLVVLAGYDRILSSAFIEAFRDSNGNSRIINIHPSLLPSFKGLHAYELAFNAKVKTTGVSVHRVEAELDAGPILAQEPFSIADCSTVQEVEARGLKIEHALYPRVLAELLRKGHECSPVLK